MADVGRAVNNNTSIYDLGKAKGRRYGGTGGTDQRIPGSWGRACFFACDEEIDFIQICVLIFSF